MEHVFLGKWISDSAMAALMPRNVFHRQLDRVKIDCSEYRGRHVLFRRKLSLGAFSCARIYITADDYYKLYINGTLVAMGPTPSYHFRYNYNTVDITPYLTEGKNTIAVHTFYQGLVNRVWQSADMRHGLLCDVEVDGKTVLSSDTSFLVCTHSGYKESGVCGYDTQILERYDSGAREVGFTRPEFDDGYWNAATVCAFDDHTLKMQGSKMIELNRILPTVCERRGDKLFLDFGKTYVGYLSVCASGRACDVITVRCAQELCDDGSLRYTLRANCTYEEEWVLSGKRDELDWFDYKAFRYAELALPEGVTVDNVCLTARHYPFECNTRLRPEYGDSEVLQSIWELCLHSQHYGVQELIQDCMEREKGFYLGDGCYTALTNMLLTADDSMVRALIDDAFASAFITDTLVTCMNCSFMQEIAEFPLILIMLILWHYRYTGDGEYLKINYEKACALADAYRRDYERDGLLSGLDKWCVVEWPKNFQHGYDVDIREGRVCNEAHISINAYYIYAVRLLNVMAEALGVKPYRDIQPLLAAFYNAFYDSTSGLFYDSERRGHVSLVGNVFTYAFDLCPSAVSKSAVLDMIDRHGISALSLFCTFPAMMRLAKDGDTARLRAALTDSGAWCRMLSEGATTTFEGWGKDTKWNTSLFHLTMSYAAAFLADADLGAIFE